MPRSRILALALLSVFATAVSAERSAAPEDAYAYIISPADGETVPSTFVVRFGLNGMGVAPAGTDQENTGHHHLLIDVDKAPRMDRPLPSTDNIRHFGKGQTETTLSLPAGKHSLQMLLGNHQHVPHYPAVESPTITITVLPAPKPEGEKDSGGGMPLFR